MRKLLSTRVLGCAVFCLFLLSQTGYAQNSYEAQYQKKYKQRISQEYLEGVYIPADLADAFAQLNRLTSTDSRKKFLELPDTVASHRLFFSLGRWMIVNWSFYEGSRLSHYLKGLGLSHPEDMARFVMITYHRNLRKVPLDVKPLLDQLIAERREAWLDKVSKGEVLFERSEKVDSSRVGGKGGE